MYLRRGQLLHKIIHSSACSFQTKTWLFGMRVLNPFCALIISQIPHIFREDRVHRDSLHIYIYLYPINCPYPYAYGSRNPDIVMNKHSTTVHKMFKFNKIQIPVLTLHVTDLQAKDLTFGSEFMLAQTHLRCFGFHLRTVESNPRELRSSLYGKLVSKALSSDSLHFKNVNNDTDGNTFKPFYNIWNFFCTVFFEI